jgi:hypothetical protein
MRVHEPTMDDSSRYEPVGVARDGRGFSIDLMTETGCHLVVRMDDTAATQLAALVNASLLASPAALRKAKRPPTTRAVHRH